LQAEAAKRGWIGSVQAGQYLHWNASMFRFWVFCTPFRRYRFPTLASELRRRAASLTLLVLHDKKTFLRIWRFGNKRMYN
jgi:hypothetical protein